MGMSVDTVIKIAKTITTIRLKLPLNDEMITRTMMLTPEHRSLKPQFTNRCSIHCHQHRTYRI